MKVMDQVEGANFMVYHGDCIDVLRGLPESSVHYSIFSPPFASLYTYSASPRDMGNCKGPSDFADHFRFLVPELYRVTKPGRLLSFHCMLLPTSKTRDGMIGLHDFRGDLIRMFTEVGWIYHSEVSIWKDPVTAMQRTKALGLLHKQIRKDSTMSRQGINDFLVTMRKPGINDEPVTHAEDSLAQVETWQRYASPVWAVATDPDDEGFFRITQDINPSETLQYRSAREDKDERHICPLQLGVIRRAIRLWTNPGDIVLSPFMGIGSEGYVALEEGRSFLGAELKASYFQQSARNLAAVETKGQKDLF
jgi:DNA modification methylase